MIQNPNIKFSDTATISMKDTSSISLIFAIENQSQNLCRVKTRQPVEVSENEP